MPGMIALTDNQLRTVMDAAIALAPERRDIFLQRWGAMLRMRGRLSDSDVADVVTLAMAGLVQTAASASILGMLRSGGVGYDQNETLLFLDDSVHTRHRADGA